MTDQISNSPISRRSVLAAVGTSGVAAAMASEPKTADEGVSVEDLKVAEGIAGIDLTDEQREAVARSLQSTLKHREQVKELQIGYDSLPAIRFDPEIVEPLIATRCLEPPRYLSPISANVELADSKELSFRTIRELGEMLRSGKVTAVELAKHCLEQLRKHDETLKCVVTFTEDLALKQAARADRELAAGKDCGPLHGIPWGAKDLIAVEGYPTTWGAPQFKDQVLPRTATVAQKLESVGAVLVAKLSLGALAMGDKWFGGMTRNPWNTDEGSSGSSAGSASAVAAGLVPFAIGSETLGSIVSPCRRCGVTGLRPTFGRISRKDCMALSWSMDKLGPIARTADDCGIVFDAINGFDPGDPTTVIRWFDWPMKADLQNVRVGRVAGVKTSGEDEVTLSTLEELGATIVDVKLPHEFPEWAISDMLDAEAATIFHDLVANQDIEGLNSWPKTFQTAHFMSAVDYLRAARGRLKLMEAMAAVFEEVDVYVGGGDLGLSNLTGHPCVVFPTLQSDGDHPQPKCSTITGRLHDEATLLALTGMVEGKVDLLASRPKLGE